MEPFKNEFSTAKAVIIAETVKRVYPTLSLARYRRGLVEELDALELKDRMRCIARRLQVELPVEPPEIFKILVGTLAKTSESEDGLRGFLVWPLTEIVAQHGEEHFDVAMAALEEMTQRFTAEFAIRPFFRCHFKRCMAQMTKWCEHPHEQVRRLASEGSRPLLPWGIRLEMMLQPPFPTLSLLEKLYRDPSDTVRLSVANHLNDLSKHHPGLVVETLRRWRKEGGEDSHFTKLARHASRTLLKAGHAGALEFHGYAAPDFLKIETCEIASASIPWGGVLEYCVVIRNCSKQKMQVMFDYVIHHQKANGLLSPKVFKGCRAELEPGERREIQGRHSFRAITTRRYHAGRHGFESKINGRGGSMVDFTLELLDL